MEIIAVLVDKLPINCLKCDFCEVKHRKGNVITVAGAGVGLATEDMFICDLARRVIPKYGTDRRTRWCLLTKQSSERKL